MVPGSLPLLVPCASAPFRGSGLSFRWRGIARYAYLALILVLPFPFLSVAQNLFQGLLVHERRTRAVTEAVLLHAGVAALMPAVTTPWIEIPGLRVAMVVFLVAAVFRVAWLGRAVGCGRFLDEPVRTNR